VEHFFSFFFGTQYWREPDQNQVDTFISKWKNNFHDNKFFHPFVLLSKSILRIWEEKKSHEAFIKFLLFFRNLFS
jgi:hypothetical protein